tara:strand:- start:3379 stop:4041 length:663 start_codon:yes stop_codon:yes gene_type:complete
MPDYRNGKIYMIESAIHNGRYYGSTCSPLHKRFYEHKNTRGRFKEGKKVSWLSSFSLFDYDDVRIVLVEDFPCENRMQLVSREAYYIRENKCLNKCIPGRTRKEWECDNKERRSVQHKAWQNKNKLYVQKARDQHKEETSIRGKEYYKVNKKKVNACSKKNYQKNKSNVLARQKVYRENNKVKCDCGSEIVKSSLRRHNNTKKHLLFLQSSQESQVPLQD